MARRISVLQGHLLASASEHDTPSLTPYPTRAVAAAPGARDLSSAPDTHSLSINPTRAVSVAPGSRDLYAWLVRDNLDLRDAIFEFLKDPVYAPRYDLSLAGFRELTNQRLGKFYARRFFNIADATADPLRFQAALESLSYCDYSLCIKSGVHACLCGGTIAKLGSARHAAILPKMDTLELPGCFAMTELAHGSDVMGIETAATYDSSTQEFVINTPTNAAAKAWIGGAAHTAKISAVFAQLTINGKWEGPHVFLVRLRDDAGNFMPGVRTLDHGPKMGLNGVDNGQIWFDHVRVAREALLDRYASVDADGRYSSPIASPAQRFGTMISGLTTGRLLIAQAAVNACKMGVTIALQYSANRPQFGESAILDYVTQQRWLLPALATTYALQLSMVTLKTAAASGEMDAKRVHQESSGLKAAATWHRQRILQECRESCGGMGVLSANKIGPMLNDQNVDTTFEGANPVMMQQAARPAVDAALKSGGRAPAPPAVNPTDLGPGCVAALLDWRQKALAAEIAGEVGAAPAKGGPKAAAAAMAACMDRSVALGWATVDASTYQTFVAELKSAPSAYAETLRSLALLYGLTRVESGLSDYLAGGALPGSAVAALRRKINGLCGALAAGGGRQALALCDGFGVPDHLLQAPIALGDWRGIGAL